MEKYECMNCNLIQDLDSYEDLESGGDIWGICPNCNHYGIITKVYEDEDEEVLFSLQDTTENKKDTFYEAICKVKKMLEEDIELENIKQYLKSITGKYHTTSEIYALSHLPDAIKSS